MTTYIQGIPALVGYTSNMAKGNATTSIVSGDVGQCPLFIYDVTKGDVNNINKNNRGTEYIPYILLVDLTDRVSLSLNTTIHWISFSAARTLRKDGGQQHTGILIAGLTDRVSLSLDITIGGAPTSISASTVYHEDAPLGV